MLFKETIRDIDTWAGIYQSTEAFAPLVGAIFAKHGLCFSGLENLTPGSNAVFRSGSLVVKLFAPVEAGFTSGDGFYVEKAALEHANRTVPSPKMLYSGVMRDRYEFPYILMERVEGLEFINIRDTYTGAQKRAFAAQIKAFTGAMNVPISEAHIPRVTPDGCAANERWRLFPESFCQDRLSAIRGLSFDDPVYVHGDLKAANVIIGGGDEITVIDFADSHTAPAAYEWPFIVFGLFGCDREMMEAYFGDYQNEMFYRTLTGHLLMHKFGAFILMGICEAVGQDPASITRVEALYNLIRHCVRDGCVRID
ncbi:MAG: aminoglycoside phosphotransferase family protein [Oscillospiraceae bacterium]|nr:aminoglycoside phosphotransferase family protein [Oscillospiraceae bacterium]